MPAENVSWKPPQALQDAWRKVAAAEKAEWDKLLERSGARLAPLGDPYTLDYACDRGFRGADENDYSDRLAWLLGELGRTGGDPGAPFGLSGFRSDQLGSMEVQREVSGPEGRMDILAVAPGRALLAVEVKLRNVSEALEQTERYASALRKKYAGISQQHWFILAAVDDLPPGRPDGGIPETGADDALKFRPITWKRLCLNLRRMAETEARGGGRNLLLAAALLHFAGAVEQNLLAAPRPVGDNIPGSTLAYLREALKEETMSEKSLSPAEAAFAEAGVANYLDALLAMRKFAELVGRETDAALQSMNDALPAMFGVTAEAFTKFYLNPELARGDWDSNWNGDWAWLGKQTMVRENGNGAPTRAIIGLTFSRQKENPNPTHAAASFWWANQTNPRPGRPETICAAK